MQANPDRGQAAAGRSEIRWNRKLFGNVQPRMTQTQRVTVRPVSQYEPAPETEPTEDRSAIVWRNHLEAAGEGETGPAA